MRKKTLICIFSAICIFAFTPVFAELLKSDKVIADRIDVNKILNKEVTNATNKYLLTAKPLDYMKEKNVRYYLTSEQYDGYSLIPDCSMTKNLTSQMVVDTLNSNELPNLCTQFDIMSYLISENDNQNLQKALDLGYNVRVFVNDKKHEIDLLQQAISSNNKIALKKLYDKMGKNFGSEAYFTMSRLISGNECDNYGFDRDECEDFEDEYWKHYSGKEITADMIALPVIENKNIAFRVAYFNLSSNKESEIAFEAINKLIDYRKAH